MASPQQTAEIEIREEVRRRAAELANLQIGPLLKEDVAGGIYSLKEAQGDLERIRRIMAALAVADLENAGEPTLRSVLQTFNAIDNQLQAIRNFHPEQATNPLGARTNLVISIRGVANNTFANVANIVASCDITKRSFYDNAAKEALTQLLEMVEVEGTSAAEKQKALLAEMEGVLEAAKRGAQSVGIVEHSKFFQEESRIHKQAANWWLTITFLLATAAVFFAWWTYSSTLDALAHSISGQEPTKDQRTTEQSARQRESSDLSLQVQTSVAKLLIFTVLLSAVVWTGRMYRAHRHNFVINRHRQNALSTFQAFTRATDDQQIKNAVLLQATQCIFGQQPTGYLTGQGVHDGSPQILEIVRGVVGAAERK